MCKKNQRDIQLWFERVFSKWADIVYNYTALVFIISTVIQIALGFGSIFYQKEFSDSQVIWTPSDNPTLKNLRRSHEIFPTEEKLREISLIVESKTDTLITVEAFEEMKQFEDLLYSITEFDDTSLDNLNNIERKREGKLFTFEDVCQQIELGTETGTVKRCLTSQKPLDFIYEKDKNRYMLDLYDSDEKLLRKVKTGVGDPKMYEETFIDLEGIFAEIEPEELYQQIFPNPARPYSNVGTNDFEQAKAARYVYYIDQTRYENIDENAYLGFEQNLHEAVAEWSQTTQAINFYMFTTQGYVDSWQTDVNKDLLSLPLAIGAASLYCFLFLGYFSPVHCRCKLATAGIIAIALSIFSGFGVLFYIGLEMSTFHFWLPFISMFVGIEQMFVLCDAVDDEGLQKDAYSRIHQAVSHAVPAMSITTLATCLAFLSGIMFTSLEALQSFCCFAAVCLAMLYLNNMTFFLAVLVWDVKRVDRMEKDCFNLCCLEENSFICCFGRCGQTKRLEYKFKIANINSFRQEPSIELKRSQTNIESNSQSEHFCGNIFSPILLSNVSRVIFLVLYLGLIAFACMYAQNIEVYFDQMYFVSEDSDIHDWFEANRKYFKIGGEQMTIFVQDMNGVDFSTLEQQNRIHAMNEAFQDCIECEQQWFFKRTLVSWYQQFSNWVSAGKCSLVTSAITPGQKIVIPQAQFHECLDEWFLTDAGRNEKKHMVLNSDENKILGWRERITPKEIVNVYKDGQQYLKDMRWLERRFGIRDTYTSSSNMMIYEQYVVIIQETIISCASSLVAIFLTTILITGSRRTSIFAFISVTLIDLFLLALIPLVDLTFNYIVLIHLIISLGLSMVFSVNISLYYLRVTTVPGWSKSEQRRWKVRVALGHISTGVLHSSVATLLAVGIVGLFGQNSYYFQVFFRMWVGIILFGIANAFIFIPILLSLVGPLPNHQELSIKRRKLFFKRVNSLNPQQAQAFASQHDIDWDGPGGSPNGDAPEGTQRDESSMQNMIQQKQAMQDDDNIFLNTGPQEQQSMKQEQKNEEGDYEDEEEGESRQAQHLDDDPPSVLNIAPLVGAISEQGFTSDSEKFKSEKSKQMVNNIPLESPKPKKESGLWWHTLSPRGHGKSPCTCHQEQPKLELTPRQMDFKAPKGGWRLNRVFFRTDPQQQFGTALKNQYYDEAIDVDVDIAHIATNEINEEDDQFDQMAETMENFRASKQRRQNSSSSSTSDRKSSQKKIDDEGSLVKSCEDMAEQTADAAKGAENARQVLEDFDEAEFEHDLQASDRKSSHKKIDNEGSLIKSCEDLAEQTADAATGAENARQVLEEFDEAEFEHDLRASDLKSSHKKIDEEGSLIKSCEDVAEQTAEAATGAENARKVLEELEEDEFEHDLQELEAEINQGIDEQEEVKEQENKDAQEEIVDGADEAISGGEQRKECPTTLTDQIMSLDLDSQQSTLQAHLDGLGQQVQKEDDEEEKPQVSPRRQQQVQTAECKTRAGQTLIKMRTLASKKIAAQRSAHDEIYKQISDDSKVQELDFQTELQSDQILQAIHKPHQKHGKKKHKMGGLREDIKLQLQKNNQMHIPKLRMSKPVPKLQTVKPKLQAVKALVLKQSESNN